MDKTHHTEQSSSSDKNRFPEHTNENPTSSSSPRRDRELLFSPITSEQFQTEAVQNAAEAGRTSSFDMLRTHENPQSDVPASSSDVSQTDDSRERRTERPHSSGSEQRPEIGLNRFLPEIRKAFEKAGTKVALVLNHEINRTLNRLGAFFEQGKTIGTMDAHELRSVFSLVRHWLEQTNGSQYITDTEKRSLTDAAQAREAYEKAPHPQDPLLRDLREATAAFLQECRRYFAKDCGGKFLWSYVENVGPEEDQKPMTYLPYEALVMTEITGEKFRKATMLTEHTSEKLHEALGLTEQTENDLKKKLTNFAEGKKLRISWEE